MKLWIATQNRHKVEEIAAILGSGVKVKSLLDLPDFPDIEETGSTFLENAGHKAKTLWEKVREPVFADDSGLEVDYLDGRPGVYSMRYSAPNPTHEKNIEKLLGELRGVPPEKRGARFRCTVVYIDRNGKKTAFEGTLEGRIGNEKKGTGGFGFDPVFFLPEYGCTVAEMPAEKKNEISHRGRAVAQLRKFLGIVQS